jgi:Na+/melibiose symporter-like transporter
MASVASSAPLQSALGAAGYLVLAAANAASYIAAAGIVLRWSAPKLSTIPLNTSSIQEGVSPWPQQARRGTYHQLLHDRALTLVCVVNLVFVLCTSVLTVLLAVYLTTVLRSPVWLSGALFTLATVLIVAAQGATTRYVSHYNRASVLKASAARFAASFILLWVLAHAAEWLVVPGLIVSIVVFTIAEMLEGPHGPAIHEIALNEQSCTLGCADTARPRVACG